MLGIMVFVLSVALLPVPFFGGYLTLIPDLMALFVTRTRMRWVMGGMILNMVHVSVFSDIMRYNARMGVQHGKIVPVVIYVVLAMAPLLIGVLLWLRQWRDRSVTP